MIKCLSMEEYRQKFLDILQLAEDWIKNICDGYEEIIICSDSHPFGIDQPICLWIQQKSGSSSYKSYVAELSVFKIEYLPNFVTNGILANESDTFFAHDSDFAYINDAIEVEPFGFIEKTFSDKSRVYEDQSIHSLLDDIFSNDDIDCYYENYLADCSEAGLDIEKEKIVYDVTGDSIVLKCEYGGGLSLNLYLITRR